MFGRATIRLGIGPHSSYSNFCTYILYGWAVGLVKYPLSQRASRYLASQSYHETVGMNCVLSVFSICHLVLEMIAIFATRQPSILKHPSII